MKKAKIKTKKEEKIEEEINKVKFAVIIVIVIIAAFVGFYYLTSYLLDKGRSNYPYGEDVVKTNYIEFNNILEQTPAEYYVVALLEPTEENEKLYNMYFNQGKDIKVYYIDMTDTFNRVYLKEETNISNTVREISIMDNTLFLIENGKIAEHYVSKDNIIEYLKAQWVMPEEDL